MGILGLWLGSGSVSNFISSMILTIVSLWYPDYEYKHWQQWMIYVAIILLAVAANIFGSGLIPKYNQMICKSVRIILLLPC
jgi:choline transport protein